MKLIIAVSTLAISDGENVCYKRELHSVPPIVSKLVIIMQGKRRFALVFSTTPREIGSKAPGILNSDVKGRWLVSSTLPQKPKSKPTEQEAGLAPDPVCSGAHITSPWLSGESFPGFKVAKCILFCHTKTMEFAGSIISQETALNDAHPKLPEND